MSERRQRSKKEEEEQARLEKQKNLALEYKSRFMPLVKFLKKEGLQFRYARVGQSRIEYFRADQYDNLLQSLKERLETNDLIRELSWQAKKDFISFRRPVDMKNLKYPHQLEPASPGDPQAKFYSFKFDTTISKKGTLVAVVVGVMAIVLFPVWPYAVKYAIWLLSLYLLVFLLGLIAFRLAIYLLCVVMGFNVWIFPNMLGDYGFFESFKPIFYAERWQRSTTNIIIRLVSLILVAYCVIVIYLNPGLLEENFAITRETLNDVHDWGVSKIKNEVKFSERALPNLQDILNQTDQTPEAYQDRNSPQNDQL